MEDVRMPWRAGQRSKPDKPMAKPAVGVGDGAGEYASTGQPVEELLLAGLTHSR